VTWKCWC